MKPEGKYYCALCSKETDSLHECVFGRGNRNISIKYNIQVPLCYICNSQAVAHGVDWRKYRKHFLVNILDIDPIKTVQAVKKKVYRAYLNEVKEHCKNIIRSYQI